MRKLIEELTSMSLDTAKDRNRFDEIVDLVMKPGVPDEIFHEVVVVIACRQDEMRSM